MKRYNLTDFDEIHGDGASFGGDAPPVKDWASEGILFFISGPSIPIQRIRNLSWPDELDEIGIQPPVLCCSLKKENEAELYLSEFYEDFLDCLPGIVKAVFHKETEYEGLKGTWAKMVTIFFQLQDAIKLLTEAPELPESLKRLAPKVQSEEEREKRLSDWKELLEKLPHCGLERDRFGKTTWGFVNDNHDLFSFSVFVVSAVADIKYISDEANAELYFCFLEDGKFKIVYDGNYDCFGIVDSVAQVFYEYKNKIDKEDSWEAGYKLIVKILEEAYGEGIPEIPKKD